MPRELFRFRLPATYRLYPVCHVHGWINLAPFSWDDVRQRLQVELACGRQTVTVQVHETQKSLQVSAESRRKLSATQSSQVRAQVFRLLSLDQDVAGLLQVSRRLNRHAHRLVRQGYGRLLRAPSLWEDAAKTLFTTNCSWSMTRQMAQNCCTAQLQSTVSPSKRGTFGFPGASQVADLNAPALQRLKVGYRGPALTSLARYFITQNQVLQSHISAGNVAALQAAFSALHGFGDYATNHLLVLAGFYAAIPYDSLVAGFYQTTTGNTPNPALVAKHYAKWLPYQYWGLKLDQILQDDNWLGN